MPEDNSRLKRRTMLQATTGTIVAGSLLSATATASEGESTSTTKEEENKLKTLNETDEYQILKTEENVLLVDKDEVTVSYKEATASDVETLETTSNPTINTDEFDGLIDDLNLWGGRLGSSSSRVYSDKYEIGINFRFGEVSDAPDNALRDAVCAAIEYVLNNMGDFDSNSTEEDVEPEAVNIPAKVAAAAAIILCHLTGDAVVDAINSASGAEVTAGAWDDVGGSWVSRPRILLGVKNGWHDSADELESQEEVPGAHLELGDSISGYT